MYMTKSNTQSLLRGLDPELLVRAAETIKLLGHPDRLKIVEVLEGGEVTVSELQERLQLRQAQVSQHLAKLRGRGIVASRRDGVHVHYRVIEPKVRHILECIRTCDT